ncbi:S41 family peptidase [Jeotgalibaca ciconiae]|uniref:PDZ domain-containing protein n=1 Tax=Jeotgalibaca ciconiae TaxID=2496265 RepID=A0A3Q9BM10_9LACT|nr:S41 family peptidase [Jeotgalibaca ciconiae]AZP05366.1 PDZ domain-containing protein [Jeotgalibaca ciconiae]HJB22581.1 S41 family peptidase [Candidatus Jeotgalibaca pullicola]
MKKDSQQKDFNKTKKRRRGVKLPVYFISMFLVALIAIGTTWFFLDNKESEESPFYPLTSSQVSNISGIQGSKNLQAVYELIMENYIDEVDGETLVSGALQGMVNAIEDPYSQYLNIDESDSLDETISASFEGIGAEIMSLNDQIVIVSPIKGSPAEEAGLLPNDIVLSADGTSLSGMTTTEAVSLIRGEKGTPVQLEVQRGSQTFTVDIIRDTIPIETVAYEMDENQSDVGIISVFSFARPTYDEIVTAVTNLREEGAKKFVFDFRQNPGGLLDQAIKIANMFVEDGEILVQTEERGSKAQPILANDKEYGSFQITEPTVMLIDEGSASASEILAGVLQEAAGVPLVGTTTFGKGTVQSIYPLSEDNELKLTVAKWLTPNGNWIHDKGIAPDYEVELPEYAFLTLIDFTADYGLGKVSEAVLNVEKMLGAVGFEVTADGYFDEETMTAIQNFQMSQELEVTGELNEETGARLVERLREVIAQNDTQKEKAIEVLGDMNE